MPAFPRILQSKAVGQNVLSPPPIVAPDYDGNFVVGTLLQAMSASIWEADLTGKTNNIYTTQDHSSSTYVRNTNLIVSGDLTCISPWNSTGANTRGGTLITPRHIAYANHFPIAIGATVRFVTTNNVVVSRTVTSRATIFEDLAIATLDSDVPAAITPAKVFPEDWVFFLSQSVFPLTTAWCTDAQEKIIPRRIISHSPIFGLSSPQAPSLQPFRESTASGDSGNPMFVLIDGQVVFCAAKWFADTATEYTGGTPIYRNLAAVESYCGQVLNYLDLSQYIRI